MDSPERPGSPRPVENLSARLVWMREALEDGRDMEGLQVLDDLLDDAVRSEAGGA